MSTEAEAAEKLCGACEHEASEHGTCVFCGALQPDDPGKPWEPPLRRPRFGQGTTRSELETVNADRSTVERVSDMERWFGGALRWYDPDEVRLPLSYSIRQENLAFLLTLARQAISPVPIAALYCPVCKTRHIDEGEFGKKVHHTHALPGLRGRQRQAPPLRPRVAPGEGANGRRRGAGGLHQCRGARWPWLSAGTSSAPRRRLVLLGDAAAPGTLQEVAEALAEAELGPLRGSRRAFLEPRARIGAFNFVRNELSALKTARSVHERLQIEFVLKLLLKIVNREKSEL